MVKRMTERLPATEGAQLHSPGRKPEEVVLGSEDGRFVVHNFAGDTDWCRSGQAGVPSEAAATATHSIVGGRMSAAATSNTNKQTV